MLVEWGFGKSSVYVNTDTGTLSVGGKEVLKVSAHDFVLTLSWCDGQWEQWEDLQTSMELSALKQRGQGELARAKEYVGDKGKGKHASK